MTTPIFTHADLRTAVNDTIHGTVHPTATTQEDRILRRAVRFVVNQLDLRSLKKRTMLSLSNSNDIASEAVDGNYSTSMLTDIKNRQDDFDFHAPFDIKGTGLIDIKNRVVKDKQFDLTFEQDFDFSRARNRGVVAFKGSSFMKKLLVSDVADTTVTTVHNCDTVGGNGTWTAAGDASSAATITSNYVEGLGAVSFTLITAAATGTITNDDFTAVDLSGHTSDSVYMWVYIPFATGLTSFALKWGSSSSAYYSRTTTKTHDNTTFAKGWNLLRFPYVGATETGTVDDENIDYLQLTVVKGASNTGTTGWIMDGIRAQTDTKHDILYYTKNGWQDTSGVYKEESTADTDLLNCDADEFELFVLKGSELISRGVLDAIKDADGFKKDYKERSDIYMEDNPSERLMITTDYQNFGSENGFSDDSRFYPRNSY